MLTKIDEKRIILLKRFFFFYEKQMTKMKNWGFASVGGINMIGHEEGSCEDSGG